MGGVGVHFGNAGLSNIRKSSNVIDHADKLKTKIYTIISIDDEKTSDNTQHLFMIKIQQNPQPD